jgi:hypothetical protein
MTHTNLLTRRGTKALRAFAAAAFAATLLALSACTQMEPGGGSENSDGIRLSGRVVGTNNSPIAGVVVAMSRSGLTDTTDALGRYILSSKTALEGEGVVLDTLRYSMNGQSLGRVSVLQWIDTLPDIQVVQRDVSGLLNTEGLAATRIEAVLLGDGIDSANPVTADFYYNALSGNYSGFLYFPPASTTMNYTVQINVYGTGNLLIGQSQIVPFNSFAGNITMPAFSAGNSKPVAFAGVDTAVALGATVNLRGTAVDSFGGAITKWEWSIGGSAFVETSTGDTSFSRATHGAYPCILRVTDNDGNTAVDTVVVASVSHGTSWVTRTSGTSSGLNKVVWAGTKFVAVGAGSTVLTSPDGITWTSHVIDNARNINLNTLAWNGRVLIATGTTSPSGGLGYYRSTDGITWSALTAPYFGMSSRILFSSADTTFFAAGQSNTDRNFLRSEDDGLTWAVDTLPRESGNLISSIWSFTKHAGRFVGVGGNGVSGSSLTGETWIRHTNSDTYADPWPDGGVYSYTMTAVVSAGTHAVAVGYSTSVIRSADGITWTPPYRALTSGGSNSSLTDLVWTGNMLVAVGNNVTLLSADAGANWARINAGSNNFASIAWNGTRLVAVGGSGQIITSP